jgi:hypothetical protein
MKPIALAFSLMLAFMSSSVMARTELLVEYPDLPVATGSGKAVTAEQVKQAIVEAATQRRWMLAYAPQGGLIEASLSWGKHTISVNITYDASSYSIKYLNSVNMNYGDWVPNEQYGNRSRAKQRGKPSTPTTTGEWKSC